MDSRGEIGGKRLKLFLDLAGNLQGVGLRTLGDTDQSGGLSRHTADAGVGVAAQLNLGNIAQAQQCPVGAAPQDYVAKLVGGGEPAL